jgi:hypothetical protein
VWRRSTHVEIIVSLIEVMIIKSWRAAQSAVQVGTRQIKTIERKSVLYLFPKGKGKRNTKRRPHKVQNPRAKKKKM